MPVGSLGEFRVGETGHAVIGSLAAKTDREALYRRYKWTALLGVSFCYLFYYTGRQTFGFAIPGIQKELGLSKEMLGWVSAAMLGCSLAVSSGAPIVSTASLTPCSTECLTPSRIHWKKLKFCI